MIEKKGGVLLLGSNFYKFYYKHNGKISKNEILAGGEILDGEMLVNDGQISIFRNLNKHLVVQQAIYVGSGSASHLNA